MTYLDNGFTALADPTRRKIFEKISRRPSAVRDLARAMPVSRPAVSQHLKVLSTAGLVRAEARGTRRIYRLDLRGVAALRHYFDSSGPAPWPISKTAAETSAPQGSAAAKPGDRP
ncbi:MAG: metalloregulator ArsR/SmtB family transcription factor [Verrucomicrobiota bacterium]